jgi:hypothetical protein
VGVVIDQADDALERWLCAMLDVDEVDVVAAGDVADTAPSAQRVQVALVAVAERVERRDTEVADRRDDDGRVTARQRSLRFFDVDYRVSVTGDARAAHRTLGRLLQALVDVDTVAGDHLPESLASLGVPIEIALVTPQDRGAESGSALTIRLLVPVQPRADTEIAPPAVALHLDVSPPPGSGGPRHPDAEDAASRLLGERAWTTVRRREAIAPVPSGAADATSKGSA